MEEALVEVKYVDERNRLKFDPDVFIDWGTRSTHIDLDTDVDVAYDWL